MPPDKTPAHREFERIRASVPKAARRDLLNYPNVHSHGIGFIRENGQRTNQVGIVAFVGQKVSADTLAAQDTLPQTLHGERVDVVESDIDTPDYQADRVAPVRPCGGGMTCSAEAGTGTMGTSLFTHDGDTVTLTNRHVVCSGEEDCTGAQVDVPSSSFQDIRMGDVWKLGTWDDPDNNNCDIAVVDVDDPADVTSAFFAFAEMGEPEDAILGRRYLNLGAYSQITSGECIDKDVETTVSYDGGAFTVSYSNVDRFEDVTTNGDSGSAWVRFDGADTAHPASIHFASSDGNHATAVPWEVIETEFGTFSVSSSSVSGQPDPSGRRAHFEVAVYDMWQSERANELYLETVILNTGGTTDTRGVWIEDTDGTRLTTITNPTLNPYEWRTYTFAIDPSFNGSTVVALTDNGGDPDDHEDSVSSVDAQTEDNEIIQARYSNALRDVTDIRARHNGVIKDVVEVAVRDGGTLHSIWPRAEANDVETWEWGGPVSDRYTAFDVGGDMGDAEVTSGNARSGSFGLGLPTTHSGQFGSLPRDETLPNYPSQGDTFEVWVRANGDSGSTPRIARIQYGAQAFNADDLYRFQINPDATDALEWRVRVNSSIVTAIGFNNVNFPYGTWRGIQVAWGTDGTHDITVLDENRSEIQSATATDENFTDGGVAFMSNAYYDISIDDWELL